MTTPVPPPPLVEVEDLRDYMSGVSLTGYQADAATDIIAGITGQIGAYLGRPILVRERTELAVQGWLAATPVTAIWEVDGVIYNLTTPGRYANGNIGREAVVRYTGGLAADEEARGLLRITILRAASIEMTNRHDDTVTVKDLDIREPGAAGPTSYGQDAFGATPAMLAPLRRWKRHGVVQRRGIGSTLNWGAHL